VSRYRLYSTAGCHLCELAWELLCDAGIDQHTEQVDIMSRPEWLQRYRFTIPVLQHLDSGHELNWPFDDGDLKQFMSSE